MEGSPNLYNTIRTSTQPTAEQIANSSSKPTTYRANCHCGHTRYTITLPEAFPAHPINRCNCTICTKNGYLLVYPLRKDVKWISGFEDLGEYKMGRKKYIHKFCKGCGSSIMIDRRDYDDPANDELCMNARMLADVDFEKDPFTWHYSDDMLDAEPRYDVEAVWAGRGPYKEVHE